MRTKQFKAESKRLLDMMIHSIYTHKEIFLRELISNASDAMDKLYYRSLSDEDIGRSREDYQIRITLDKDARTLTITDNGCGMTQKELEDNLGTIAKSGSLAFKSEHEKQEGVDIIGQFGVGFYSAFMVADEVTVYSRAYGAEDAYKWHSEGVQGYTVEPCDKEDVGTQIILHIKENTEEEQYDEFLDSRRIQSLVKQYSDYIRYPIVMDVESSRLKEGTEDEYETVTEEQTVNSMVPLWKKNKQELTDEDYHQFYQEQFHDYEPPLRHIHVNAEGQVSYNALLFLPGQAPFDYYTKDYEAGLQLYSSGVKIMDKCADLLPEYFSFVRGLVDSEDLSLNISRELLQHDRQLKLISKNIEKKIKNELLNMLKNNREDYETFYKAFGMQLKFGAYNQYGIHKDAVKDLLLFPSSREKKLVSLKEYVERMPEGQSRIYYACGESVDKADILPQSEAVKDKGFEILYFTEAVDEFAIQMLMEYEEKPFQNIASGDLDLGGEEEKEALQKENEDAKALFETMTSVLENQVGGVRFTNRLKSHPVCLTSEGAVSIEMEKVLNTMPGDNQVKAETILEINHAHPIAAKLKELSGSDEDKLKEYTKILYAQARLIEGLAVENPVELSNAVCELMAN